MRIRSSCTAAYVLACSGVIPAHVSEAGTRRGGKRNVCSPVRLSGRCEVARNLSVLVARSS